MHNIILAIYTSSNYCSVSIYKKQIYVLSDNCHKEHTTKILPMIYKILLIANIKLKEINYIAFSKGPGSFTGIRIATIITQSLSLSLKIPIIAVSTLAIIAEKASKKYHKNKILIALHAKTDRVYWAQYTKNNNFFWAGESTESIINIHQIKKNISYLENNWLLVGDGWKKINYKNFLNFQIIKNIFPNAEDIIPFALFNIKNNNFFHATKVVPNYLNNVF